MTTIRISVDPALPPPYAVVIAELDELPRMLSNRGGDTAVGGDRVVLRWRERDPLPLMSIFARTEDG